MTNPDGGLTAPTAPTPAEATRTRRHATFLAVAVVAVIAVARDTAQSNALQMVDPSLAGGFAELPTYLVTGALAYLLCLPGLFLLRRWSAVRAGRVALVYGLVAALPFLLDYWTALPVTLGGFAVMAGLDAGRRGTGLVGLVLGLLALALSAAALIYRMTGGTATV